MILKSKHIVLWLLATLASQVLTAQMPAFKQIDLQDFEQSRISKIYQSRSGWVWFGGYGQLLRFDGQEFESLPLPDSLGKLGARVTAMHEFRDTLWVGFSSGRICFLPQNFSKTKQNGKSTAAKIALQNWEPDEGTPQKQITGFGDDKAGNFWISTYGEGLYCLKNKRLYQFDTEDDQLTGDEIYNIATDAEGNLWAATDNGVSICSMPEAGKKTVRQITTRDGLPDEIIPAICRDAEGNLWLGTDQRGVCFFDSKLQKITFQTPNWQFGAVTSLAVVNHSELWIGTATNGLFRLDIHTGNLSPLPTSANGLRRDRIHCLLTDLEGGLWVVGEKTGVFLANARFGWLPTEFGSVQAILQDRQHRLWIGSEKGLFLLENGRFRQIMPRMENIISLFEAANGAIWAGSFGQGVFVISPAGKLLRRFLETDGLANGSVLSIAGNHEKIWLATLGGVSEIHLDATSGQPASKPHPFSHHAELGSNYIYKVFFDSRGRAWFGTDGRGLVFLENGKFERLSQAAGRNLKTILSIVEDRAGRIWFSAAGQGLFCFDGQKFRHFGKEQRLHSLDIASIAVAGSGELVIGYSDGLDLLNPETDHLAFFDSDAGVQTADANLNASFSDEKGNVWLGTQRGILRVAAGGKQFIIDPKTQFTAVSLFQKAIDFQTFNSFSHDENYLSFDFIGLWYEQPDAVRYRFKLEGFDHDWKVSKEHLASYPNLPPGDYVFRVQSSEHGKFEGTEEASFAFKIKKPFWAEWWFVLPSVSFVLFGVFRFIKNREERLRREEKLEQQRIASQFETLKSQINPHFLFNSFNTLIAIIEENPKIAVEYVEHLSDFFRTIMVYREKDLIPLQEELELVRNFDFLLKKRYEDSFQLVSSVNGQQGFVMPLTLQMLVENAVKHNVISKTRPLRVEISVENEQYLVVRNNVQRKIKPEPSTRFGLQSLVHRYQLLGERQVEILENAEEFVVKIPIL